MKRILSVILCLSLLFTAVGTIAADEITIIIDGAKCDGKDHKDMHYKSGTEITISVPKNDKCDYVLRIYNSQGSLIDTQVLTTAEVQSLGSVEFKYALPKLNKNSTENIIVDISQSEAKYESEDGGYAKTAVHAREKIVYCGGTTSSVDNTGTVKEKSSDIPWTLGDSKSKDKDTSPVADPTNAGKLVDAAEKSVTNTSQGIKLIENITKETLKASNGADTLQSADAKFNMALLSEFMAGNISRKKATVRKTSNSNRVVINKSVVTKKDVDNVAKNLESFEKAINDDNVTLNRKLYKDVVIEIDVDVKKPLTVEFDKEIAEVLKEADTVIIANNNFRLNYSAEQLSQQLENGNYETTIEFVDNTAASKTVHVSFDDESEVNIKVAFPCNVDEGAYKAILDKDGNAIGGKYNPSAKTIEATLSKSETVTVKDNLKDFVDLRNADESLRKSIQYLASAGIFMGKTENEFDLNGEISRAEIVTMVMRVLSLIDPNEDGGFADVESTDWFFGAAGSAKKYDIVNGFIDDENVLTFRGYDTISKEQIYTIISRILTRPENGYIIPTGEEYEKCLNYADKEDIGLWARDSIALSRNIRIIVEDDSMDKLLRPKNNMTRGAAAVAIYRLFVTLR